MYFISSPTDLEVGESPSTLSTEEQVPQPLLPSLDLELLHDRDHALPPPELGRLRQLGMVRVLGGEAKVLHIVHPGLSSNKTSEAREREQEEGGGRGH